MAEENGAVLNHTDIIPSEIQQKKLGAKAPSKIKVKGNTKMKMKEIMETIEMLAKSQGFYGRLYRDITLLEISFPERYDKLVNILESQNFSDTLDLVLFFES